MLELLEYLIACDMSDLETLLGDMYQPCAACIVVLFAVIPPAALAECLCLLPRILGGGRRE